MRQHHADERGAAAADAVAQRAEERPEQRAAEQRDGGDEPLLRRRQSQVVAKERRQRTQQHPGHEADVEVEQGRHQRRRVARRQEPLPSLRHHAASSFCPSPLPIGSSTLTTPSSTRVAIGPHTLAVRPRDGRSTHPVSRSTCHACSGHTTEVPVTMPSASGPALCGHRLSTARKRSPRLKSASVAGPDHAPRAPPAAGCSRRTHVVTPDPCEVRSLMRVHLSPCAPECGMNCAAVRGERPSSHASVARAFDFFSRSSSARRTGSGA